jgi:hypothetical protein
MLDASSAAMGVDGPDLAAGKFFAAEAGIESVCATTHPAPVSESSERLRPDSLTFLYVADPWGVTAKTFRPRQTADGYEESVSLTYSTRWTPEEVVVSSLRDVQRAIEQRLARQVIAVPGALSNPQSNVAITRKSGNDGDPLATLIDAPRHVFWVDLDFAPPFPGSASGMTPQEVWEWVCGSLPPELIEADLLLHLSSSFATEPGKVKAHGFFYLDRPLDEAGRNALLGDCLKVSHQKTGATDGVADPAVNRTGQPLYFCNPSFVGGAVDPLAGTQLEPRWFYIDNGRPRVAVPSSQEMRARSARHAARKAAIKGETANLFSTGSFKPEVYRTLAPVSEIIQQRQIAKTVKGKAPEFIGWASPLNGMGEHFYAETLATIRQFVYWRGTEANPQDLYDAVRAAFEFHRVNSGRAGAYFDRIENQLPATWRNWTNKVRERERPQMVAWRQDDVELSIEEGEAVVRDFADTVASSAISLHAWRLEKRRAISSALKALEIGDRNLAWRIAQKHGLISEIAGARLAGATVDQNGGWAIASIEDVERAHAISPEHRALKATVALGKTRDILERAALLCARKGMRVVFNVATHALGDQIAAEIKAIDATTRGSREAVKVATWRGANAPNPAAEMQSMCPRAAERAAIRSAGLASDSLCGSRRHKRGYCTHHPDAGGDCAYRLQRTAVSVADIVIVAGAPVFGLEVPTYFGARSHSEKLLDPDTGAETGFKVTIEAEPVDLVIADEFPWLGLIEGTSQPTLEPHAYELTMEAMETAIIGPPSSVLPDDSPFWDTHGELADFLSRLHELVRESGEARLMTYGEIYALLGGFGDAAKETARGLNEAVWKGVVRPKIDPQGDAIKWAAGPVASWNRKMLAVTRVLRALKDALSRHENAPVEDLTGLLLIDKIGPGGKLGWGVVARHAWPVAPSWRRATMAFIDASFHASVARRFLASLSEPIIANVPPAATSLHVAQTWDRSWGMKRLDQIIEAFKAGDRRGIAELAQFIEVEAALARGKGKDLVGAASRMDTLVLCPKRLEDALNKFWGNSRPAGVELWHFNNVRGLNAARGVASVISIGRSLPSAAAIFDLRAIIDGKPYDGPFKDFVRVAGAWRSNQDRNRAWTMPKRMPALTDPLANEVLEMICFDELTQAVLGRPRVLRRAGEGVRISVLGSTPIPGLPVDELVSSPELLATGQDPRALAAARGVSPVPGAKGENDVIALVTGLNERAVSSRLERAVLTENKIAGKNASDPAPLIRDSYIGGAGSDPDLTPINFDPATEGPVSSLGDRIASQNLPLTVLVKLRADSRYRTPVRVAGPTLEDAREQLEAALGFAPALVEPIAPKRPRGRPRLHTVQEPSATKRGRGRPRKAVAGGSAQ